MATELTFLLCYAEKVVPGPLTQLHPPTGGTGRLWEDISLFQGHTELLESRPYFGPESSGSQGHHNIPSIPFITGAYLCNPGDGWGTVGSLECQGARWKGWWAQVQLGGSQDSPSTLISKVPHMQTFKPSRRHTENLSIKCPMLILISFQALPDLASVLHQSYRRWETISSGL